MTYYTSRSAFNAAGEHIEQTPRPPNPITKLTAPPDEPAQSIIPAEPPPARPQESAPTQLKDILSQFPPGTRLRLDPPVPSRVMHMAHCKICRFDLQNVIDEAFVNWECVYKIAREFEISARAIYRHAHATGLFDKRDRNLRRALGHLIHEADRVVPTAETVLGAAKIFAHLNSRGEWVNPPTHVTYSVAPKRTKQQTKSARRPAKPAKGRKRSKDRKAASPARKLLDTRGRANKRSTR
jgi:hypothetical protein